MAARKKKKTSKKKAPAKRAKAPQAKKSKASRKGTAGGRPRFIFGKHACECLAWLAGAGNTIEDAARIVTVSKSTLERAIAKEGSPASEAWAAGKSHLNNRLRVAQVELAIDDKNPTMQIWLGKQLLGQRDYKRIEVTGAGGGPLEISEGGEYLELLGQKIVELQRSRRKVELDLPD
jgi:hypothetical protein